MIMVAAHLLSSSQENLSSGLPTRRNTNLPVQPVKMATGLKFLIEKVEGFCLLCSENKGADQLHGCCTADLYLCFSHMQQELSHDSIARLNCALPITKIRAVA